jgi:soluble lytic murein transglycosylase-like protein
MSREVVVHCVFSSSLMSVRAVRLKLEAIGAAGATAFGGLVYPVPAYPARLPRLAIRLLVALALTPSFSAAADIYSSTDANGVVRWSTQALDSSYRKAMGTPPPSSTAQISSSKTQIQRASTAKIKERRRELYPLVDSIARRLAMDTNIVMALIEVESGFNTQAVSPKGARGLMQLMPTTAAAYGMRDIQELHDPEKNLDIGIRHLKSLLATHRGQWALALASYNAGQGAVAKHGQRIPGYTETMLYVPAILAKAVRPGTQDPSISLSQNIAE